MRFALRHGRGKHVITVATEHKCVLKSCEALVEDGAEVTCLPVDADGFVNPAVLAESDPRGHGSGVSDGGEQ